MARSEHTAGDLDFTEGVVYAVNKKKISFYYGIIPF